MRWHVPGCLAILAASNRGYMNSVSAHLTESLTQAPQCEQGRSIAASDVQDPAVARNHLRNSTRVLHKHHARHPADAGVAVIGGVCRQIEASDHARIRQRVLCEQAARL